MALVSIICDKLLLTSCKPTFSNLKGFFDEKFSDVTVNVSYLDFEKCTYKLHRNILAGCSSVLYHLLVDNNTNQLHQTIDITFMSPAEIELLIIFMYTGEMHFESVSELCFGLYAANMYKLDILQNNCCEILRRKLLEDCGIARLILHLDERFNCRADNAAFFDLVDEMVKKDGEQINGCGKLQVSNNAPSSNITVQKPEKLFKNKFGLNLFGSNFALSVSGINSVPSSSATFGLSYGMGFGCSNKRNLREVEDDFDDDGVCWYHRKFGENADKCLDGCTYSDSEDDSDDDFDDGVCWYHIKFGDNARKCLDGCTYYDSDDDDESFDDDGLCWYHRKFGENARKCRNGCSY